MPPDDTAEQTRLSEDRDRTAHWRRWGPYLAERQWGTVREDYSADGDAWRSFPFEHAHLRAYRWGEDGLLGMCDNHGRLCFAPALWNEQDPILKERLFGLSGKEGNHGEDVKELYYYLDALPSHAYNRALYKYPQREFPYAALREENARRGFADPEFELIDTGIFDDDRYFDVQVEYAKAGPHDVLIRIVASNRGPVAAPLQLVPQLWFRNTWSYGRSRGPKPRLVATARPDLVVVECSHAELGPARFYAARPDHLLFTENESNARELWGSASSPAWSKDAFHRFVVHGDHAAVNPEQIGSKAGFLHRVVIPAGGEHELRFRLVEQRAATEELRDPLGRDFERELIRARAEADAYYAALESSGLDADSRHVQRAACAGLLWTKQAYLYVVEEWLDGDPASPPPPRERLTGRNASWRHVHSDDVLSMPDKWEFPWFASWDLAFHTVALALIDVELAKRQLVVLTREWYMHPDGQIPAYEWTFSDVNPPVTAWAAWRVYSIERKQRGQGDRLFLERVFQKLLLNFTWWVNRKDANGNNVFEGGFLGLDNIGVFNRSEPLPMGGSLEQSDATSWMAMYALNMLTIALELAKQNPAYEDIASKFFEHFLSIAGAMNEWGDGRKSLFNYGDGFFYDQIRFPDGSYKSLKVRSVVGMVPLFAIETLERAQLDALPGFGARTRWFLENRPDRIGNLLSDPGGQRLLLSIVSPEQLRRILGYLLSEAEFLSSYGVRSLSKVHRENPYLLSIGGREYRVDYDPGEASSGLFGGNSNWRGPVWMPMNFLLIEALQKFHHALGDDYRVEFPSGSGTLLSLWEVASAIAQRLTRIFRRDQATGRRPVLGAHPKLQSDPQFRDHLLFFEYFHGDDGSGRGASHQTGWTGLIAKILQQGAEYGTLG